MKKLSVQQIELKNILLDLEQPRKTVSENRIGELAKSIESVGLLQPITVRAKGKKYVIVMGERRYRAHSLLKKATIDCFVKDFEGGELVEVQLIENLQRRELEPLDEADSMAMLLKKLTPSEIADQIGKSIKYVYSRLKLVELIEGLRTFVATGEMSISLGCKIGLLPPEQQQQLMETLDGRFDRYTVKQALEEEVNDLNNAPFDIKDDKLLPSVGSCTGCAFNSSNQGNLFGDAKSLCSKSSCFTLKKNKSFHNLIEQVKKDGRLLVPDVRAYSRGHEENEIVLSIMEEKGLELILMDTVDILKIPVKPTVEILARRFRYQNPTQEQLENKLVEETEHYEQSLETYNKASDNGYIKGVYLDTSTYLHENVMIKRMEVSEVRALETKKKKMADCTPAEQIDKIKEKEIRKKHIDNNRQFKEISEMVRESEYPKAKKALSKAEKIATCFAVYENLLGYHSRKEIANEVFSKGFLKSKDQVKWMEDNFNNNMLHTLIRKLLVHGVHFGESNHFNNGVNGSFYKAARPFLEEGFDRIESEYSATLEKREQRLKERIDGLEAEIKVLKSA